MTTTIRTRIERPTIRTRIAGAQSKHAALTDRLTSGHPAGIITTEDEGEVTEGNAQDALVGLDTRKAAKRQLLPQVSSLVLAGHSFLDYGSIAEGGAGRPYLAGRTADLLGLRADQVTNLALFGSSARYSWWKALQGWNPGAASWPHSATAGVYGIAYGTNDARSGVGTADGWQECSFKAAMEAIVSRFRAGAVFEDSHSSCAYSGTWSTVTPETDESATTLQCSGSTYRKTTTAASKVTITTPTSMGRNLDGVWVSIGLQGAESGAKVQVKLDGVHHGYVNVGRGDDYGTSFGSASNAVGYRIGLVYRLWIPTTYTDPDELYTTQHTIEVIHVSNVGSGGIGLIFDYWSIEAADCPVGVLWNVPQPADSSTAGGAFTDTTVATTYNTWLSEVAESFTVDDTGDPDPRVQVADLWSAFGGSGWTELSNVLYYGTDRLHPSHYGAKVAADLFLETLVAGLNEAERTGLLGVWPDAIEPLTEAPTIFFADGTPLVVVDDFERTASETALGGDGVEQLGAWGVDVFGQAYLSDALFAHWSERDDFARDDDADTLGQVEFDASDPGDPGAWVAAAGTWGISSGSAYLSAKPGSGHAIATRDLGSTTQGVEVALSNVDTDLVSVAKYGLVFRYVDASNYLLVSYGGVTAYLSKMVGGVLTNIASITSVGSRPHVEVGADDVVHFWSGSNGNHSAVTYTITDAALQHGGAGTKVGLWVASDAAAGLTGRFDGWRAWTTLSDADAQSTTRSLVTWDLSTPDGVLAFEAGATEDDPYSFAGAHGLIYRYQDNLNYYRLDFSLSAIYGVATLYKVVAGVATSLGSWWQPLGPGIVHAISFDGSTHALYHDGVASSRTTSGTTITDSTYLTGNLHGIQGPYTSTTSAARWRDLRFGQTVGEVAARGDTLFDTSPADGIDVYQYVDGAWVERGSVDSASLGLGDLALLDSVGAGQIDADAVGASELATDAVVDENVAAAANITGSKVAAASTSARGTVELATTAETQTGTDTDRAVTPAGAAGTFVKATNVGVPPTTGEYWNPTTQTTAQVQSIGQLRCGPLWLPTNISITGLRAEVTSGGSGGNTVALLIYRADATTGRPGALYYNAGTINGTSATTQEITFGALALAKGLWWLGVLPLTGTAPTLRVAWGRKVLLPTTNTVANSNGQLCFFQGSLSAAPDPMVPVLGPAYPPQILVKVA